MVQNNCISLFEKSDGVMEAKAVAQYKKEKTDLQFQILM